MLTYHEIRSENVTEYWGAANDRDAIFAFWLHDSPEKHRFESRETKLSDWPQSYPVTEITCESVVAGHYADAGKQTERIFIVATDCLDFTRARNLAKKWYRTTEVSRFSVLSFRTIEVRDVPSGPFANCMDCAGDFVSCI